MVINLFFLLTLGLVIWLSHSSESLSDIGIRARDIDIEISIDIHGYLEISYINMCVPEFFWSISSWMLVIFLRHFAIVLLADSCRGSRGVCVSECPRIWRRNGQNTCSFLTKHARDCFAACIGWFEVPLRKVWKRKAWSISSRPLNEDSQRSKKQKQPRSQYIQPHIVTHTL